MGFVPGAQMGREPVHIQEELRRAGFLHSRTAGGTDGIDERLRFQYTPAGGTLFTGGRCTAGGAEALYLAVG